MAVIPLDDPRPQAVPKIALWQLGFRPFFLLAGFSAVFLIGLWLLSLSYGWSLSSVYPGTYWHSHEMIFGYTSAVISGFLLTAVRNWTGIQTIQGKWLVGLAVFWLLGRILPLTSAPLLITSIVSILYFPLLAFALSIPLIRADSKGNLIFLPLLMMFGLAEVFFQLGLFQVISWGADFGIELALKMILLLIVLMGGRVIPFFIGRATSQDINNPAPAIEKVMFVTVISWMLIELVPGMPATAVATAALIAFAMQLVRVAYWHTKGIWSIPMLWVLYVGYIWLVAGFLFSGLSGLLGFSASFSIHAFTTGGIGIITLGMMSRVALGHTGRSIDHNRMLLIAFALLAAVPLLRVIWPLMMPQSYSLAVNVSGILWIAGFLLFCVMYLPILIRPRIDNRPG